MEYQASIRQLTEINDKWIIEWRAACDVSEANYRTPADFLITSRVFTDRAVFIFQKFQLLEEQRIDYVGTTLWNYANIISSTCVADDEVMYPVPVPSTIGIILRFPTSIPHTLLFYFSRP